MNTYIKFLKNLCFRLIPDKLYLSYLYRISYKEKLNLKNPQSFNSKLQWLKLYDRNPIYTKLADKYEAKKLVAKVIGDEHIIPTYGSWDHFEDIDFNLLPEQFVLKCTHDSGGMVICKNKANFDYANAKKQISECMRKNFYWQSREWPYKNIHKQIIAEKYMNDNLNSTGLTDYKFYCFHGEPKFLYVSQGLEDHSTASISFLNLNWTFAPYKRSDFKTHENLPPIPSKYEEMLEISRKLSNNIPFVRVDLYQINETIYFSELTFSPCGGFCPFEKKEQDIEIGKLLHLSPEYLNLRTNYEDIQ